MNPVLAWPVETIGSRPAGSRNSPKVSVPPGWGGNAVVVAPPAACFGFDDPPPHAAASSPIATTSVTEASAVLLVPRPPDSPLDPAPATRPEGRGAVGDCTHAPRVGCSVNLLESCRGAISRRKARLCPLH